MPQPKWGETLISINFFNMKNFSSLAALLPTIRFFALLILCLPLDSCKKDALSTDTATADKNAPTTATTAEDAEILDRLTNAGIRPEDLEFKTEFVIYQGDAAWNKAALLDVLRKGDLKKPEGNNFSTSPFGGNAATAQDRQRGIFESDLLDAVAADQVKSINYFVRPSVANDCGAAWVTAITNGANKWGAASYCRVKFYKVTSQAAADIVFGSDSDTGMPIDFQNLGSGTVAQANLSFAGQPGPWVSINDAYANSPSSEKLNTIMHELGHTLGYEHTDESDGIHIHGTPNSDAASVMLANVTSTTTFSAGDLRASRIYYPDALSKPTAFSAVKNSSTSIQMTYTNAHPTNKPYYWIRGNLYNSAGTLINHGYLQSNLVNGTQTVYWVGLTPGQTYKVALLGSNFRRDIGSLETAKITIAL